MPTAARPEPKPVNVSVREGDIGVLARSFRRSIEAAHLSPATVRIYTISVAQLAEFLASKGMPLVVANIAREHVEEFLKDVLAKHSAGTAETRYRGIKAFFKWALEEGEISRDPMERVKRPKVAVVPPPMLSDEEVQKLLKACDGRDFDSRRDTAIIRLFIDTGLRRSELAYLTVDDVNLDINEVKVMGKGGRGRIVPFGRKTAQALDRYERERGRHRHATERAYWLGRQGPMQDAAIDLMIRRRARQAGIQVHAHMLRHGFAHRLKSDQVSTEDIMALAGWRSYDGSQIRGQRCGGAGSRCVQAEAVARGSVLSNLLTSLKLAPCSPCSAVLS